MTAGQAFVAFVLLLLSLAASFAFGLMIGKGQADERLVVRKEPEVINEASLVPTAAKKPEGKIVDLPMPEDEFPTTTDTAAATDTTATAPVIVEEKAPTAGETAAATQAAATPAAATPAPAPEQPAVPHYAQLFSSSDQKAAEGLAAKLINGGFMSAYVERGTTDKGPIFRVRVKFASETEARAAEPKLREYSKDVWILK